MVPTVEHSMSKQKLGWDYSMKLILVTGVRIFDFYNYLPKVTEQLWEVGLSPSMFYGELLLPYRSIPLTLSDLWPKINQNQYFKILLQCGKPTKKHL